jgi:HlyD family secretion protein
MNKKKFVLIVLLLAAAIYAGWLLYQQERRPFYYAGTLEVTKVDIPARLATVIAAVEVQEGARVSQGELLLRLDCSEVAIQEQLAERNFVRGKQLLQAGSLTREAFDQLQSRRDAAALSRTWCEVHSPLSGTVLSRYYEPGEWVGPGSRLLTVADTAQIWAYIYVPQAMLAALKVGREIVGFLPELAMQRLAGRIVKINEEAEFTPKNVQTREERTRLVYGVKIQFVNADSLLKPGMPVEVSLAEGENG